MKNKKKWIAALLLLTFLCMSVMPGAVFADTTSSSASQTESAEDAEAKAKADAEAKAAAEAAAEAAAAAQKKIDDERAEELALLREIRDSLKK